MCKQSDTSTRSLAQRWNQICPWFIGRRIISEVTTTREENDKNMYENGEFKMNLLYAFNASHRKTTIWIRLTKSPNLKEQHTFLHWKTKANKIIQINRRGGDCFSMQQSWLFKRLSVCKAKTVEEVKEENQMRIKWQKQPQRNHKLEHTRINFRHATGQKEKARNLSLRKSQSFTKRMQVTNNNRTAASKTSTTIAVRLHDCNYNHVVVIGAWKWKQKWV